MPPREVRERAVRQVHYALQGRRLVKGPCYAAWPDCYGIIQAHHHDYSKPLEVIWTCRGHHRALDKQRADFVPRPAPEREERFRARKAKKARAAEFMRLLELCQALPGAGVVFHTGWFPTAFRPPAPVPPPSEESR